jgi:hypothetical protein
MGLKTYTIELKVSTSDEGHEAMTQLVKQSARDMLSSAMLIASSRSNDAKPMIAARASDAFYSHQEIEVMDASWEDGA